MSNITVIFKTASEVPCVSLAEISKTAAALSGASVRDILESVSQDDESLAAANESSEEMKRINEEFKASIQQLKEAVKVCG